MMIRVCRTTNDMEDRVCAGVSRDRKILNSSFDSGVIRLPEATNEARSLDNCRYYSADTV